MTRIVREADAQRDTRLLREFAASGISVGCANTFLNPVEVVKTRMQLYGAAAVPSNTTSAAAAASGSSSSSAFTKPASGRFLSSSTAQMPQTLNPTQIPKPWPAAPAGSAAAAAAATPAKAMLAAAASAINNPAPVTATQPAAAAAAKRPGFLATAAILWRAEGASAFTRGIQASATRAVCNGGIRLGLYDPIKGLMSADGTGRDLHMGQKLAAGSISGGIGAVLTTPIELAKTRLQAPGATSRSMTEVLKGVIAARGFLGLWAGATPSVLRLIMLNSSMVATYDEVKGRIQCLTGWSTGLPLVLSSSMVAGLVTCTVINPADVIRAYMQTGRGTSLLGIARSIYAKEGSRGFFKGWTAAYARTGPQTLIIFTVSELVRPLFGLQAIGGC